MRRLLVPLLLAALLPSYAAAQQVSEPEPSRFSPAYGLHYGMPLRFSVAVGGSYDLDRHGDNGVVALVEQGQHGSEASAGYFHTLGQFGAGVSLRGAVLRTSGEPWNADPHTTYVGGEVNLQIILGVGGRAGIFRRASSTLNGTHDSIVTLGISIGS
jgi:hypothetical protein